ncbi:helix-turn-helix domain-containing protein [Paenibacillus qinlingensis]|uniref:helix-turn-helix domain-containing protein n=1 Tax=Paenibacillus qinlingensis TaxID=1837343 RepID=UPI0015639AA8|nr:helix-turn-helix domain-containing protein [Paenibacillus qinlingensis]NQX59770.1 helix-turn-helix domain-containing protein [Paenibacillus qinlingensis]
MLRTADVQKKKFFTKVYLVCILIVFLYASIAVGFLIYKNMESLNQKWDANATRSVEQMREQMDIRLQVAFNLVYQLKRTEYFLNYSNDATRNYANITLVLEQLKKNREAFENYGYRIDVMKPDDNLVITTFGTIDKDKYYKEMALKATDIEQIDGYIKDSKYSNVVLVQQRLSETENYGYDTISFVKKELTGRNDLMFVISFFKGGFYPDLLKLDTQVNRIGVLSGDQLVDVKEDLKENEANSGIPDEVLAQMKERRAPYVEQYGDDQAHLVSSSVLPNVRYLFMLSGYAWQPQLSGLLFHSLLLFGLLLVIGAGVAFLASRNIYRPIHNVLTIFKGLDQGRRGVGDEALESTDDMSFITATAVNISRMNDSLKETIQNNRLSLRDHFLRNMLYGITGEAEVKNNADKYGLEHVQHDVTVVVMELVDAQDLEAQFPVETVVEIKARIFRMILEAVKKEFDYEQVELEHKRHVLIVKEQQIDRMKRIFTHILSGIEADTEIRVVAAIGRPVVSLSHSAESYQDAVRLLERRFALEKNTVITVNDVVLQSSDMYTYPLELERELITFVLQGKTDQVQAILSRILDENLEERYTGGEKLARLVLAVDVTVHRILNQMNKSYRELFGQDSLYDELKQAGNRKRVRERIYDVFAVIMASMANRSEKQDHTVAEQLLAHIHAHFNEDISLSDIAEQFNLSLGYISLLFKKFTGENFKEYLNQYRVTKAKEYLNADEVYSINDVAGKVGCNNVNTFIRIFKKYEGVSPGQYAKRNE